jgi:xylulokinase
MGAHLRVLFYKTIPVGIIFLVRRCMSLIGIDIGTTGCKVMIFDEEGQVLAREYREYAILTPRLHWAEQDAEHVWTCLKSCLFNAVSTVVSYDPPQALAISAQGEAIIPVDGMGQALRPAILGMDTRTTRENQWLEERFGADDLFRLTGMPVHTVNTLPKLIWLKRNEPAVFHAAEQFLLYEDFILRRLTGHAKISRCLASRTQMYNISTDMWAEDILNECEIDCSRLAELAPEHITPVGVLRKELAAEFGLTNEIQVMAGGHDQACAALGSGVIKEGLAMVSTGTAEVVEIAMSQPVLSDALCKGNISIYRHVVPGLYLAMTLNQSGGLVLRWFRDTLCQWDHEQAIASGHDAYEWILKGVSSGPTSLLVLPHFSGSGTPSLDTLSKGAIIGLTFATDRHTIAKAILEGLTYELRVNLDLLRNSGVSITELHAVGGGTKSSLWLQLKADICQVGLCVPRVTDAACLGAALLAGVGIGIYPNVEQAVLKTVKMQRRIEPDAESVKAYERRFRIFEKLYPALKDIQHQL